MKKPTGVTGRNRVEVTAEGASHTFAELQLGAAKADIERSVVGTFQDFWARETGHRFSVHPNPENDHDFTADLPGGSVKLELTELVPPGALGNPFNGQGRWYTYGEVADAIVALVEKKSARYGKPGRTPIHLIIYKSHYWPIFGKEIAALVRIPLAAAGHVFENVFFVDPNGMEKERVVVLCPVDISAYAKLDIDQLRRQRELALDPREWRMEFRNAGET